jgi:hypothetical protein
LNAGSRSFRPAYMPTAATATPTLRYGRMIEAKTAESPIKKTAHVVLTTGSGSSQGKQCLHDLPPQGSLISPEAFKHATIEVGKAQKAACQVTRMGDWIVGGRLDRIRLIVNAARIEMLSSKPKTRATSATCRHYASSTDRSRLHAEIWATMVLMLSPASAAVIAPGCRVNF